MNEKQDKKKENNQLLTKYINKDAAPLSQSSRLPKSSKNSNKTQKNTFTIDTKSKKSKKSSEATDWYLPGNEEKLNDLQNMPIK